MDNINFSKYIERLDNLNFGKPNYVVIYIHKDSREKFNELRKDFKKYVDDYDIEGYYKINCKDSDKYRSILTILNNNDVEYEYIDEICKQ